MMTIFFTIIFIAELIITFWIISQIIKCLKWTKETNQIIIENQAAIKNSLTQLNEQIKTVHTNIDSFSGMLEKKKEDFVQVFSKDIITNLGFFLLNTNVKSVLTFIDIILSVRKFIRKK